VLILKLYFIYIKSLVINPTDQQQIAQSIESASRELISELPSLAKEKAIISGVAINTPTLVRRRKRLTSDVSWGGERMHLRCGRRREV